MIDWSKIDTVLLDMDGTLLDLHFDNYFWLEHVPKRYAQQHGIDIGAAKNILGPKFSRVEGTMNWYCLDYWTRELGMDIPLLKAEVDHLIALHPFVLDFLTTVRSCGKKLVLVTNAHEKSLDLKMRKTRLGKHFDVIICAHDLGLPKEEVSFWGHLQTCEPFDRTKTLLIDDNLTVLRSAQRYGIKNLLAVHKPDTKNPPKDVGEFYAIHSFRDIMPSGSPKM